MQDITKFVGLDVSAAKIAVSVADAGRGPARYWGLIPNRMEDVRKLFAKLGDPSQIEACYEAGPTGYELHRFLTDQLNVRNIVVAPSLIPIRPGERVKTDRRDSLRLAELLRAGELTQVRVPTQDDEALRDLNRLLEDVKEDLHRVRQRLSKFLLRHNVVPAIKMTKWKSVHRRWLDTVKFSEPALQLTFDEHLHTIDEMEARIKRLETEIRQMVAESHLAPLVEALQTLRGVKDITAITVAVEVGDFTRFATANDFMGYTGLVPSESSSGVSRRQGNITKSGNRHLRRVLVESSWSYRYKPAVHERLRRRQVDQPPAILNISWRAQVRLHSKYMHLVARGKPANKAVVAASRELAGFMWAIGQELAKMQC